MQQYANTQQYIDSAAIEQVMWT